MSSGYKSHLFTFVFSSLWEILMNKEMNNGGYPDQAMQTQINRNHTSAEERERDAENAEWCWHFREPFLATAGRSEL